MHWKMHFFANDEISFSINAHFSRETLASAKITVKVMWKSAGRFSRVSLLPNELTDNLYVRKLLWKTNTDFHDNWMMYDFSYNPTVVMSKPRILTPWLHLTASKFQKTKRRYFTGSKILIIYYNVRTTQNNWKFVIAIHWTFCSIFG